MQLDRVLSYLEVEKQKPSVDLLHALIAGYAKHVPWESASRIVRRGEVAETAQCPRWPDEFWETAFEYGTGGTCFESNYAFFEVLKGLGFQAYLTVNNMNTSIGCHTACVVALGEQRWLMDAGYPVHVPLRLDSTSVTEAVSPYQTYSAVPDGEERFQIERAPHPNPYCFTLIDRPIAEADYRTATINDYDAEGLFLDKVIINKLVDGHICRFNSAEQPFHIQRFVDGHRIDDIFEDQTPDFAAAKVARFFTIDQTMLKQAFTNLTH